MDINDLRVVTTVLLFFTFIGIVWWAFGKRRQAYFDAAAQMPFTEEDELAKAAGAPLSPAKKRKES